MPLFKPPPWEGTAYKLILDERRRQQEVEGFDNVHDNWHTEGELELAALAYRSAYGPDEKLLDWWPWESHWWKPKSRVHNLVRSGALYLAAMEWYFVHRMRYPGWLNQHLGHVTSELQVLLDEDGNQWHARGAELLGPLMFLPAMEVGTGTNRKWSVLTIPCTDQEQVEMSQSPITETDYLDLARLVHRIRRVSTERAAIPIHSGSATSKERKERRSKRRELREIIEDTNEEIVAWAMSIVPVSAEDIGKSLEEVEKKEEKTNEEGEEQDEPPQPTQ